MARLLLSFAMAVATIPASGSAAPPIADRLGRPLPPRVASQLDAVGISGGTTLDAGIQRAADNALDRGLAEARASGLGASGGAVVVLGIRERAILALASAPDGNRATRALPAGSVAKPFVAVASIGAGMDPRELRPCPARFSTGGATIRNWRREDTAALTMEGALADSCNTFFASLAAGLWRSTNDGARTAIHRTYAAFGFGFPTGMVPGEDAGRVPPSSPSLGDLMVLAIGQGPLTVTPLQIARAYAAIASPGGAPWLDVRGRSALGPTYAAEGNAFPPVRTGLELAVRAGTARDAFRDVDLRRVPVAGKTGSAEVGDVTPYAWFAAYAPAHDPRYVVAVVVERGRRGALSAAPIARDVLDRLLDLPSARGSVLPPLVVVLLLLPLLAGLASPGAGALIGFVVGLGAGALAGGSVPMNGLAFAAAGWTAGALPLRWGWTVGAAVGTVALPVGTVATVAARAAITGSFALAVALALSLVSRIHSGERPTADTTS